MAKFVNIIVGAALIAVGVYLEFVTFGASTPLTAFLIQAGAGMVIGGIGTLLQKGPLTGVGTATRNPIAPWNVVYGRAKVGGIIVYIGEFDESNKYLDLVIVLACHACKSVDALLFDGQRVLLDENGCSFTPSQQTIDISSIARANDVVTVQLSSAINHLQSGDTLIIKNVSDRTFNGSFPVTVTGDSSFTYIAGGTSATLSGTGQAMTTWPNYRSKVYMEALLGDHTETFAGMRFGTPYDGDTGNLVQNNANTWTSDHRLLGKCSAFLRLHYNDQIFANGLPQISFRISGKKDIYDPRLGPYPTVVARPGLNNDTTFPYANPDQAIDGDFNTSASISLQHTHAYAGCIWSFAGRPSQALWLNVRSEVPVNKPGAFVNTRSAGIWYSLDAGANWTMFYNSASHPGGWDSVALPASQDVSLVQVMAFTDAHDDMIHYIADINLATGPFSSREYSENAALCIADYLAQPTWGFKAAYGTEIPLDRLTAAVNICDEPVGLAAGGTEPRYTCSGGFPLTTKRGEVLQNLLTACGGRISYTGGQFVIFRAAWAGTSLSLGDDQPLALMPKGTRSARITMTAVLVDGNYNDGYADDVTLSINGGANLVVNGGAEQGMTGWTLTEGGMETIAYSTYVDPHLDPDTGGTVAGNYPSPPSATSSTHFFGGGEDQAQSTAVQSINMASLASTIDSGGARFLFSAYLGGWGPQRDNMTLTLDWLDASLNVLNTVTLGPVTVNDRGGRTILLYRSSQIPFLASAAGPFRWKSKVSIRDLYNGVKGTYVSPTNNWQSSDIPPYAQDALHGYTAMVPFGDANLAADGGDRRWLDIQLPFTISTATAQRLCKIELLRRRQQGTGTFAFQMALYQAAALDVVQMTLPILGWSGKLLELSAHRFTQNKQQLNGTEAVLLGTELDVQETDPSIYDWSTTEELTAQGFQQATLPAGQGSYDDLYLVNGS